MNHSNAAHLRRPFFNIISRVLLSSLALALLQASAYAQQRSPDPEEAYRVLMQRRMERSQHAVTETLRRRFEEGKNTGAFPSDAENKAGAKPAVVRAVSPEERKALAHTDKGLDYFSRNKFEQAIKEYDEAIRLYPMLAAAHNDRGSALFALGRFDDAAACFNRAIEIDPKYAQAHLNLALVSIKLGREREANDSLLSASRAYITEGDEQFVLGHLAEAEVSYKSLLQIDPDYAVAHFKLGLVYNAANRYAEAVEAFKRVINKLPDSADAYEDLGEAYTGLRKHREAAEAAEHAVKLRPASPLAHYVAGLAHASLGKHEQALADLDKLKALKADEYARLLSDFIEKKASVKK